jgi:hypothetical protein
MDENLERRVSNTDFRLLSLVVHCFVCDLEYLPRFLTLFSTTIFYPGHTALKTYAIFTCNLEITRQHVESGFIWLIMHCREKPVNSENLQTLTYSAE